MKPTYREFYEAIYLLKKEMIKISIEKGVKESLYPVALNLLDQIDSLAFSNKNYLEISVNWVRNRTDRSLDLCLDNTDFNSENKLHQLAKDFIKECFKNVR